MDSSIQVSNIDDLLNDSKGYLSLSTEVQKILQAGCAICSHSGKIDSGQMSWSECLDMSEKIKEIGRRLPGSNLEFLQSVLYTRGLEKNSPNFKFLDGITYIDVNILNEFTDQRHRYEQVADTILLIMEKIS